MNLDAKLTVQEERVISLVAWGASYKMVADKLCKSVHTVVNQVRSASEKIGITPGELPAYWFCKHPGLTFDLSPIKRKGGAIILLVLFSVNLIDLHDPIARRSRRGWRTETVCRRLRDIK